MNTGDTDIESITEFQNDKIICAQWFSNLKYSVTGLLFAVSTIGALLYYFFFLKLYQGYSAYRWLWNTWTPEADYDHAKFFPLAIAVLLFLAWKKIKYLEVKPKNIGLIPIVFGILLMILSVRTKQERFAVVSLPFILIGISYFLWGTKISRKLLFPIFLIFLSIRMPGIEQATNSLQIISSTVATKFISLLGIELIQYGNNIKSATTDWGFDIAEGCSGIRSLMALSFIAAIIAHVSLNDLWKKILLFAASLPISMMANSFRISTIILVAEFIDVDFASSTYHDWSGLLLFFPMGLFLLLLFRTFLIKGIKMFKKNIVHKKIVRSTNNNI